MKERKTQEEITKIIELHEKWLKNIEGGEKANLSCSDLSGSDLRGSDLSMAKGLKDKYEFLKPFESKQGYIVYKVFNGEFPPNPNWKIEPKSIIEEVVNPLPTLDCACAAARAIEFN